MKTRSIIVGIVTGPGVFGLLVALGVTPMQVTTQVSEVQVSEMQKSIRSKMAERRGEWATGGAGDAADPAVRLGAESLGATPREVSRRARSVTDPAPEVVWGILALHNPAEPGEPPGAA